MQNKVEKKRLTKEEPNKMLPLLSFSKVMLQKCSISPSICVPFDLGDFHKT